MYINMNANISQSKLHAASVLNTSEVWWSVPNDKDHLAGTMRANALHKLKHRAPASINIHGVRGAQRTHAVRGS